TLPEAVLARPLRDLHLRARSELLPRLVEAPEPPRQPSAGAFEEGAAQPRMPLEHAAGGETGERKHQLDGVAARDADDTAVGMIEIASRDVVAQRGLARGVKANRHRELLDRVPERLELRIMDVP